MSELTQKLRARARTLVQSEGGLGKSLRHFDTASAAEWASGALQRAQNVAVYGKVLTIVLCSYFIADLLALGVGKMLPEAQFPHGHPGFGSVRKPQLDDYNIIMARNLFSSKGLIPGEETTPGVTDMGGVPVRTSLPFNLIGTMIFQDEMRSIATIEDKGANQVYPVRVQDEIPNKAKIVTIAARRVVFVNEENHRREYVDIPETESNSHITIAARPANAGGGIERVSDNSFTISRSEVDRALSDLNNILTQARAVPNFENGQPAGYKLFQIVPGSIYQKLGIQDGDVVCGFDGQPANDPAVAFQKLQNIRDSSHLDLCIKRGGKQQTYSYDFK